MSRHYYVTEPEKGKLLAWHTYLQGPRGRADRAAFRRAASPEDVMLNKSFINFLNAMPKRWHEDEPRLNLYDAALVACLVARVKQATDQGGKPFAQELASQPSGSSRAAMSELRFQQLQKSRTETEFFTRMSRAIALLKAKANIGDLAESTLHWLYEFRHAPAEHPQHRLAVKWANEYYSEYKIEHRD